MEKWRSTILPNLPTLCQAVDARYLLPFFPYLPPAVMAQISQISQENSTNGMRALLSTLGGVDPERSYQDLMTALYRTNVGLAQQIDPNFVLPGTKQTPPSGPSSYNNGPRTSANNAPRRHCTDNGAGKVTNISNSSFVQLGNNNSISVATGSAAQNGGMDDSREFDVIRTHSNNDSSIPQAPAYSDSDVRSRERCEPVRRNISRDSRPHSPRSFQQSSREGFASSVSSSAFQNSAADDIQADMEVGLSCEMENIAISPAPTPNHPPVMTPNPVPAPYDDTFLDPVQNPKLVEEFSMPLLSLDQLRNREQAAAMIVTSPPGCETDSDGSDIELPADVDDIDDFDD